MALVFNSNSSPKQGPSAQLGNAIVKFCTHKPQDDVKDKPQDNLEYIDQEEITVSPHNKGELDVFRPFSSAIGAVGSSIMCSIHGELAKEQRNAKPLLKEAQH